MTGCEVYKVVDGVRLVSIRDVVDQRVEDPNSSNVIWQEFLRSFFLTYMTLKVHHVIHVEKGV